VKDGNYTELIFNVNPYFQLSLLKTFYCFCCSERWKLYSVNC